MGAFYKTKAALRSDDQAALTSAFSNLKSHYKSLGIFTAVILGIYALMFLVGIFAGGMALLG